MKKKSPTKIIEETPNPELESNFLRFRGIEMIRGYNPNSRKEMSVGRDNLELGRKIEEDYKEYSNLHTHPGSYECILPSDKDMVNFLGDKRIKSTWIAQRDEETGKVFGYLVIRKTNKTPEIFEELKRDKKYKGSQIPGFTHLKPNENSIANDEVNTHIKDLKL